MVTVTFNDARKIEIWHLNQLYKDLQSFKLIAYVEPWTHLHLVLKKLVNRF